MRRVMHSWFLRAAVLLWVAGFFVVFIPAHRRGVVQLPGHGTQVAGQPYCPLCTLIPSTSPGGATDASASTYASDASPARPADAPVNCAVCFLKARLDTPPTLVLPPVVVAVLEYELSTPPILEAASVSPQHRFQGRAPPSII